MAPSVLRPYSFPCGGWFIQTARHTFQNFSANTFISQPPPSAQVPPLFSSLRHEESSLDFFLELHWHCLLLVLLSTRPLLDIQWRPALPRPIPLQLDLTLPPAFRRSANPVSSESSLTRVSSSTGSVPPPLPPSVEEAYRRKCIQLKTRLNEVEESNDASRTRLARLHRAIDKMRLERAFLLEQLAKRTSTNVEDSEGSPSPPPTVRSHHPSIFLSHNARVATKYYVDCSRQANAAM